MPDVITTFLLALAARAATPVAATPWSELTASDVAAYCDDIREIHPGMVDPKTPSFPRRVIVACNTAAQSAHAASSYWDWREIMDALVTSFRDGHTWITFHQMPARVRWPGFLVDGRGDQWVVRRPKLGSGLAVAPPEGARLLSCDGQPAEAFLRRRLDNREVDWSKLPERIRLAHRAFIEIRPDRPLPAKSCDFEFQGKRVPVALDWRSIPYVQLQPQLAPFLRRGSPRPIKADFAEDGHVWITLGNVSDETSLKALEAELMANQAALRRAPYVAFDMRGNLGGNSMWGAKLASVLWGEGAVEARRLAAQSSNPDDFGKYWRRSPASGKNMLSSADDFSRRGADFAEVAKFYRDLGNRVLAAENDGLLEDECCKQEPRPSNIPELAYRGPVFVLTDAGAFSSGVVVINTLKRMGAVQVGEASGQNEIYAEGYGPVDLPSGLAGYRIPFSLIRQPREELGGLPPDIPWNGAMDDDQRLREWIAGLARKASLARMVGKRSPHVLDSYRPKEGP